MKYQLSIEGREHSLEVKRNGVLECALNGAVFSANVVEVRPGVYSVLIGEKSFAARVDAASDAAPGAAFRGQRGPSNGGVYVVQVDGACYDVVVRDPRSRRRGATRLAAEGKQIVKAPMPGKVVKVLVAEEQVVEAGHGLMVVEAMKMQNEIKCPKAGKVVTIPVREGQAVNAGETLAVVE